MNERIQELAEQCRIEKYNHYGDLIEFGFDEEKFAELIVKECAEFCERTDSYLFAKMLKEHFGVES